MNNENSFNVLNPLFFTVDPTVDIPKPKVESLQSQQECNSSQLRWSRNFCVGALICGLQVVTTKSEDCLKERQYGDIIESLLKDCNWNCN